MHRKNISNLIFLNLNTRGKPGNEMDQRSVSEHLAELIEALDSWQGWLHGPVIYAVKPIPELGMTHPWLSSILSSLRNSQQFLNQGICIFILHWAPQTIQPVLFPGFLGIFSLVHICRCSDESEKLQNREVLCLLNEYLCFYPSSSIYI